MKMILSKKVGWLWMVMMRVMMSVMMNVMMVVMESVVKLTELFGSSD